MRQINHRWLKSNKRKQKTEHRRTGKEIFVRRFQVNLVNFQVPRDLSTSVGQPLFQVGETNLASFCHHHAVHAAA